MKNLSTLNEKGHVEVAHNRESAPVKLYYEMHGNGPQKVLLVMGMYSDESFSFFFFFLLKEQKTGLSTPCSAWDLQVAHKETTHHTLKLIYKLYT